MSITEINSGHFKGNRAVAAAPSHGPDARSLKALILELQQAANAGAVSQVTSLQVTAATLTGEVAFVAPADGEITAVKAFAGVAAASGESMTIDVKIGGVTVLTAVITLDDSSGTDVQSGILAAAVAFSADDKITIDRTYAAGGGPTPMTDTIVTIGFKVEAP